ncbi:MAG: serine hydrolase [Novosphingobium sp.]|uniref:serine hydrolase n=1 Tax=Novosphingobium sp. TaxID=1874826 RepID=UPI003C7BC2CA
MRHLLILSLLMAAVPGMAQAPSTRVPAPPIAPDTSVLQSRANDAMLVINGAKSPELVFSPEFLQAVPPAKLAELSKALSDQFGPILSIGEFERVSPVTAKFNFHYAKALAKTQLQIDPESSLISGLLITDVVPVEDSPEQIQSDVSALHGSAGFTLFRLGPGAPKELLGYQSNRQFAIGSAFKLWVLDALAEDVARGRRKWSDVVFLTVRSFPSGVMHSWPQGSPVTLATLATQMISISDNTATDMLIKVLGREAIAARVRATGHSAPSMMLPVLSTLEAFSLKLGPADQRAAYAAASDAQQQAMLMRLDPTLSVDKLDLGLLVPGKIWSIDTIEWFASPRDIVGVMQSLARRKDPRVIQILSVNPGLGPDVAKQFTHFGFKGGSEEGVLNLSFLVQNRKGEWYVASASWNDPARPVDQAQFSALARRMLERIK